VPGQIRKKATLAKDLADEACGECESQRLVCVRERKVKPSNGCTNPASFERRNHRRFSEVTGSFQRGERAVKQSREKGSDIRGSKDNLNFGPEYYAHLT
jgi:hypothetical protein